MARYAHYLAHGIRTAQMTSPPANLLKVVTMDVDKSMLRNIRCVAGAVSLRSLYLFGFYFMTILICNVIMLFDCFFFMVTFICNVIMLLFDCFSFLFRFVFDWPILLCFSFLCFTIYIFSWVYIFLSFLFIYLSLIFIHVIYFLSHLVEADYSVA